jgi:hypothetical protein
MCDMFPAGVFLHVGPRNLPPVLALSLYAAANVVVISFVPSVLFAGDHARTAAPARVHRLPAPWLLAAWRSDAVRVAGGAIGVAGLTAAVTVGGGRLVWSGLWIGLALTCALVGGLWKLVDPWAALYDLAIGRRVRRPALALPAWLGAWPATAVSAAFVLASLAPTSHAPWLAAALAAGYTAVTLAGMALFGRDAWLSRCEGFGALLDMAGRFGPVAAERDADGRPARVWLRPWGVGLLDGREAGWDRVVLLVVVLSGLAFDGVLATDGWRGLAAAAAPGLAPLGAAAGPALRMAGLLLIAGAFLLVLALVSRLTLVAAGARAGDPAPVATLARTLLPIGLLYAAALLSASLLPRPQPGPVLTGTAATWFLEVTLVVIGHAIAVHLAHRSAGQRFRGARRAALSQYPVLVLLVTYTMTSLWILAQPVVALT